jgi:hypothetical protein
LQRCQGKSTACPEPSFEKSGTAPEWLQHPTPSASSSSSVTPILATKFFAKKLAEHLKDLRELVTPAADFVQFLRDDRHPLNDD